MEQQALVGADHDLDTPLKRKERRRELRLAGFLATAIALAGLWVVSSVTHVLPFPPTSLAGALLRAMPGDVATFFIELLAHWAQRLLVLGALAGTLVLGAEVLVRTASKGKPRPMAAGAVLAVLAAGAILLGPPRETQPLAMVMVLGATALLYAFVARRFFERLTETAATDPSRRRALQLGIGGALGLAAGGALLGWFAQRFGGPDRDVVLVQPAAPATVPPRPSFPEIAGLSPEVTSVDDHYVVDINLVRPSVEADGWLLSVFGEVESPLRLSFNELQERFEVVEEHQVLACISNEVGGDLIGHSVWGGVRMRDVLEAAGVRPSGVDLLFRAEDGYSDSIPVELGMDPAVLIAVSQNGEPLTKDHGFPCRLRVPQIYGMKNVKWVTSIEVVDYDYQGYWMERGWSDEAVVRTESRIDVPTLGSTVAQGEATWVAGISWAGGRGISKVEVSTDDGATWSEAMLKEPISPYSWTLWAYEWTPEQAGSTVVVCRATDGEGDLQTEERNDPHPAGATGYHHQPVTVA